MPKNRKRGVDDMIFELENGEIESSSSSEDAVLNTNAEVASNNFENIGSESIVHNEPEEPVLLVGNNESEMQERSPCTTLSTECDSNSQSANIPIKLESDEKEPLMRIRFRDKNVAKSYKHKIKRYILQLINSDEEYSHYDNDSDLELIIWDVDSNSKQDATDSLDSMFIIDTNPSDTPMHGNIDVPAYSKKFDVLDNKDTSEKKPVKLVPSRPQECFNCDGKHTLRDCPYPKDMHRVNQKRRAMMARPGRYHLEEQNKTGNDGEMDLVAGRISGSLRRALGLQRNQLPQHVYRMRSLGYPPGWLLNAKIQHSGIAIFDSSGKEVTDPLDEDGEIPEEGSKDKYDVKKILDFPGFNIPASSKYIDECEIFGCPPMSDDDSKNAMLERLAPRQALAYRRKKLAKTQTAAPQENHPLDITMHSDMDIDDEGNQDHSRMGSCSLPLSTAAMLLLPPPPPPPPPPAPRDPPPPPDIPPPPPDIPPPPPPEDAPSIPDLQDEELSLDDLETRKMQLLAALDNSISVCSPQSENSIKPAASSPTILTVEEGQGNLATSAISSEVIDNSVTESPSIANSPSVANSPSIVNSPSVASPPIVASSPATPRIGGVRQSSLGTPVVSSSISKLPADVKFSKDICDIINFENLPDSTGKYEKISGLIKRVRIVVHRLQEENN